MSSTAHAARFLDVSGLGTLVRRLDRWDGVLVLSYHRIGDAQDSPFDRSLFSADAQRFDEQLGILAAESEVVSPHDLLDVGRLRAGRRVLITFDDGYRDNHDVALPLLRARGLTATFFVATALVSGQGVAWWDELAWIVRECREPELALPVDGGRRVVLGPGDREPAIREVVAAYHALPGDRAEALLAGLARSAGTGRCPPGLAARTWMTWPMVRALRDAGMTVGGHTVTHPVLARVPPSRQREEILGCARVLEEQLGEPMRFFSYPIGRRDAFGHVARAALLDAGVRLAFSDYGGMSSFSRWDPLDVRRINPHPSDDGRRLRAALTFPRAFARW